MFGVFGYFKDFYEEYIKSGDTRITKWPLMDGPATILTMVTLYLLFVKIIGPRLMKYRKPFDLRQLMLLYNAVLVIANIYIVTVTFSILFRTRDKGICRKETPTDPDGIRIAELGWFFLFLKLVEFLDTVFFVLRKKFKQVSALHVIHHSVVPLATWAAFRVEPASYNYFFPLFNVCVHVVMYSYYALSALGPNVQKYLWWKKYLTTLQMIQFVMVFPYMLLLHLCGCEVSKFILATNIALAGLFLVMFNEFYRSRYLKEEMNHGSRGNRQSVEQGIKLDALTKDHSLRYFAQRSFREQRIQDKKKIG